MADLIYNATGQVIDNETSQGIPGVRVEAWDVDLKTPRPLAVTETNDSGRFALKLDFRKNGFQVVPDVVFKVFRNEMQLESMESSLSWNANSEEDITISIVNTPKKRKDVKDRITAEQFLMWSDFVQQSDFMGVFKNFKDKAGTILSLIPDSLFNTFAQMEPKPIRVSGNTEKEFINQDVNSVKRKLESDNISVEVLPYNPRLNKTFFADISTLSTGIKSGQKVNLYQENGTVKYYSVVKEKSVKGVVTPGNTDNHKAEIEKFNEELKAAKEDSKRKEEQITKLQQDLSDISKQQEELQKVFKSNDFKKLLKTIGRTGKQDKPIK
jgi:hypothetical protein